MQKKWFQSKTIWGGLITLLSVVLSFFGYQLTAEDQELLVSTITGLMALLGGLLSIWGRLKASKSIRRGNSPELIP